MGTPMAPSDLTWSDLERSKSMSHRFQVKVKVTHTSQSLISREGAKLGHMLLINHQ